MLQTGKQTIAIHILSNISRSKSNLTIKRGQLIAYNKGNIYFFNNHAEIKAGRLVPVPSLFFQ